MATAKSESFDIMGNEVPEEDLAALIELTKQANERSREGHSMLNESDDCVAVEIGTWAGQSALALSTWCDKVYCIDHWKGNPTDMLAQQAALRTPREAFRTFCGNMGDSLFRSVVPLVGHSLTYAAIWPFQVDLIFIDADHRYEHVKADIEAWWPHVKPGGVLCGHDYGVDALPGVKQAVDEFAHGMEATRHGRTIWAITKPKGA